MMFCSSTRTQNSQQHDRFLSLWWRSSRSHSLQCPLHLSAGDPRGVQRTGSNRQGSVTVVAMVVLVVLIGVTGQLARRVLSERRQLRQEVIHLQAEKLAEAGLHLAERSLKQDPAWSGQIWQLPAGTIHQTNSAEVTIRLQEGTCTVVARYPSNSDIPVKVTRTRRLSP